MISAALAALRRVAPCIPAIAHTPLRLLPDPRPLSITLRPSTSPRVYRSSSSGPRPSTPSSSSASSGSRATARTSGSGEGRFIPTESSTGSSPSTSRASPSTSTRVAGHPLTRCTSGTWSRSSSPSGCRRFSTPSSSFSSRTMRSSSGRVCRSRRPRDSAGRTPRTSSRAGSTSRRPLFSAIPTTAVRCTAPCVTYRRPPLATGLAPPSGLTGTRTWGRSASPPRRWRLASPSASRKSSAARKTCPASSLAQSTRTHISVLPATSRLGLGTPSPR